MSTRPPGDDALTAAPFAWQATGSGTVIVFRGGRRVVTVGGRVAAKLTGQLERADVAAAQQLLARATGNYRRGNERSWDPGDDHAASRRPRAFRTTV